MNDYYDDVEYMADEINSLMSEVSEISSFPGINALQTRFLHELWALCNTAKEMGKGLDVLAD